MWLYYESVSRLNDVKLQKAIKHYPILLPFLKQVYYNTLLNEVYVFVLMICGKKNTLNVQQ